MLTALGRDDPEGTGNLYGTTSGGFPYDGGIVFELAPNAAKTAWTHKILYSFCPDADCTDGDFLIAGLIMDASGNLYGTTNNGGPYGSADYGEPFRAVTQRI